MSFLKEIKTERLKKIDILSEKGVNAYPAHTSRTHRIEEVLSQFESLSADMTPVTLVGRVMARRGQGAILFVDITDGVKIQAILRADVATPESFTLFTDTVDLGDFIEVSGTLFVTQRGERSLSVTTWKMLTKSLLPLPDKYHGLQDEEERLRKRYLDLLTNPELREMFRRKEKFWDVIRTFMKAEGFIEVETPTLELTTGGAEARPFMTKHNDFDVGVYLRISVGELWQKRLLAAGFEKTFEIGRVYRNEGTSPNHLQEFTNIEFYAAYQDYTYGMALVENLYRTIAQNVYGKTQFTRDKHTFDLALPWTRIDYQEEIERQTGINIFTASEDEIISKLNELTIQYEGTNRERLTDTLWKYCRKNITGPAFLINHPKLVSPLAKSIPGTPEKTERFQPLIAGTEVGNGYSELNDPIEQRERFDVQQELIERGDKEAMMPDWDFVEMLEHGMPPACGYGFGERLFAILEDKPIRDTQLFPLMRPRTQ